MTTLTKADVEQAALAWLETLGWRTAYGTDIAPGAPAAERDSYGQAVWERRLREPLAEPRSGHVTGQQCCRNAAQHHC